MFQLTDTRLQNIATWFATNMRLSKMQVSMTYPEGLPMQMGFECVGEFRNSQVSMVVKIGESCCIGLGMPFGRAVLYNLNTMFSLHGFFDGMDYETEEYEHVDYLYLKTEKRLITPELLDHYKALFIEALRHAGIEGLE